MKVLLFAHGSTGDVLPIVAIAKALAARGHSPLVAAPDHFANLVEGNGASFLPTGADFRAAAEQTLRGKADDNRSHHDGVSWGGAWSALRARRSMFHTMAANLLSHVSDFDLLTFTFPGRAVAAFLATAANLPAVLTLSAPGIATGEQPHVFFPQRRWGALYNRMTYSLSEGATWPVFSSDVRSLVNEFRPSSFDWSRIHAIHHNRLPTAGLWSPLLSPRPNDWSEDVRVVGHPFVNQSEAWTPPNDLVRFLDAGAPPVYVGFGSIPARNPRRLAELVLEAISRAGVRAVLLKGWGGLDLPSHNENVYVGESLPHDWLFPRMAAVVHHCGCGTAHAGLRAGVPTVPTPVLMDQPFWAERLHRAGVATKPIPRKVLTETRLADALRQAVTDEELIRNARELGARLRAEDGASSAAAVIEAAYERTAVAAPV